MIKKYTNLNYQTQFIMDSSYINYPVSGLPFFPVGQGVDVEISASNLNIPSDKDIVNFTLYCFFDGIVPTNTEVEIVDSSGNIIDSIIVNKETTLYESGDEHSYIAFDLTKYISTRRTSELFGTITFHVKYLPPSVAFLKMIKYSTFSNGGANENSIYYYFNELVHDGLMDGDAFSEFGLGVSGQAKIKLFDGKLFFSAPLLMQNLVKSSIPLFLCYNSASSDDKRFGLGWNISFYFHMDITIPLKEIVLTDYSGNKKKFVRLTDSAKKELRLDFDNYTYYCYSDASYIYKDNIFSNKYIYITADNIKIVFVLNSLFGDKFIIETIVTPNNETFSFEYTYENIFDKALITRIVSSDDDIGFVYDDNTKHLIRVESAEKSLETELVYSNSLLTQIKTYKKSIDPFSNLNEYIRTQIRSTYFVYDNSDKLVTIYNYIDKIMLGFNYLNGKISQVIERPTQSINNLMIHDKITHFEYGIEFTKIVDCSGEERYYYFDRFGSVLSTFDENGITNNYQYGVISELDGEMDCHALLASSEIVSGTFNLLDNGSFELDDIYGWNINFNNNCLFSTNSGGVFGDNYLTIDNGSKKVESVVSQNFSIGKGGNYCAICYYKKNSGTGDCYFKITIQYYETITTGGPGSYNSTTQTVLRTDVYSASLNETDGEWHCASIDVITVPNVSNVSVEVIVAKKCSVSIDEVQFSKTSKAGGHNLVRNSNFELLNTLAPYSWSIPNNISSSPIRGEFIYSVDETDLHDNMFGNVVLLVPESDAPLERTVLQEVYIQGGVGDIVSVGVWCKSYLTISEHAALILSVHDSRAGATDTKEYIIFATKNIESWQILSSSIVIDIPYDRLTITLLHYGFHKCYFEGAFLYKDSKFINLEFNENSTVAEMNDNQNRSSIRYDNKKNKIFENTQYGENITYKYDDNGKLIQSIDDFGNLLNFTNSENGVSKTLFHGQQFIYTEESSNNGLLIKKDQFGYESKEVYDCFGNKISYIESNGSIIRKEYNDDCRLKTIERLSFDNISFKANIQYDSNGNVSSIVAPNGAIYSFDYDDYGRLTASYINNVIIEEKAYEPAYSSCFSQATQDIVTNGNNSFNTSLDIEDGLVTCQKFNNLEQYNFKYDAFLRMTCWKKILNNEEGFIEYDNKNNIISETQTNGFQYVINRDNMELPQVERIRLNDKIISINYTYDYEFHNKARKNLLFSLENKFQTDVVFFGQSIQGKYGLKATTNSHSISFNQSINGYCLSLNQSDEPLSYSVDSVNSLRSLSFKYEEWRNTFNDEKVFLLLAKIKSSNENIPFFSLSNENDEPIFSIYSLSNSGIRILINNQTYNILNISTSLLNVWNCFGVHFSFNSSTGNTNVVIYLNGASVFSNTISNNFALLISSLSLGGTISDQSSSALDCLYLCAGSNSELLQQEWLYLCNNEFLNSYDLNNHYKYSGVHYNRTFDSHDVINLNGSFESLLGLKPYKFEYDYTFVQQIADLFAWDETLMRHVFCANSFNKPRLTYNLSSSGIKYKFDFSLDPNCTSSYRVVGSISSDNPINNRLVLYVNNGELFLEINGNSSSVCFLDNVLWHSISIQISSTRVTIKCDSAPSQNYFVTISSQAKHFNFGCSISTSGLETPQCFLEGKIKDIVISYGLFTLIDNQNLFDDYYIKKYDSFGRKINICANNYVKNIGYEQPCDSDGIPIQNRTSTRISSETDSLNNSYSYEYDYVGNLVRKTCNNSTVEYEYDGINRLIRSSTSDLETQYIYSKNGDLETISFNDGTNVIYRDFIYDQTTKKLLSIEEDNTIINFAYADSFSLYPSGIGDMYLSWRGKLLSEIDIDNQHFSYVYDFNNRRIEKITDNSVIKYFYDDRNLVYETDGTRTILYKYAEKNNIFGFDVIIKNSRNSYLYLRDEFGVINGILNSSGSQIVTYIYDDYGRLLSSLGDQNVISQNHILYKGYYYDNETGFYLLGKRYYYPFACRFISPDDSEYLFINNIDKCQFNLYAYCDCNPIMYHDPSGNSLIITAILTWDTIIVPTLVLTTITAVATGTAIAGLAFTFMEYALPVATMINSIKNEKGLFETMLNIVDIKGVYYFTLFTTAFYGAKYLIGLASRNKKLVEDATGYFEKTFPKFIRSILENTYVGLLFLSDCIRSALMFTNSISHPLSFAFNITLTAKSEKNYRHNIVAWENIINNTPDVFKTLTRFGSIRFINDQNNPVFYNIHYGFSNICDSGCGIIATFNALRALGKIDEDFFPKLIYLFESKNLVFGKIGALPSEIRSILHDMYNVSFISVYNLNDVIGPNSLLRDTTIEYGLIATFFNNQSNVTINSNDYYYELLSMHTVCYLATNISSNNNLYQGLNNPDSSGLTVSNIFKSYEVFKDGIIFEVSANEE